ncbi:MAG: sulfide-dependent adenosine diphosphate thiazole synthase [candidate division WOR-3 bacterium]|nr:sulfide-dependent adenosine diphosphate thiazole synthase [candidate division WOR-3 bacterium]MDW8113646.1 sulfide-dependent adenosine diphosphate thiazole synthase [candidate division WOR-3 bacterium]
MLDEIKITKAIIESYLKDFNKYLESDALICGAGPAGLSAGYYLAKAGVKVVILEKNLRPGGGLTGGGMMFNKIVVDEEGKEILTEFGVSCEKYEENYYVACALETLGALVYHTIKKGAKIFNLITVEDLLIHNEKVSGVVINWTSVILANLHIDPMTMRSKFVVDATGHGCELVKILEKKMGKVLFTTTGGIIGEKLMNAEMGEKFVIENTKEVYHNLFVCGMAVNAVFGGPRMGPIFSSMLLSGKKVAEIIKEKLK